METETESMFRCSNMSLHFWTDAYRLVGTRPRTDGSG